MPSSLRRPLLPAALAVSLAVVASLVGVALPAQASGTLQVSTTTDSDAGVCSSGATTVAPPVSLRDALCAANNAGDTTVVNVPAGTYALTRGPLLVGRTSGTSISIVGAGASAVTISGGGTQQVLNLDANIVGGIDVRISGVTIADGVDNTFGGAAVIGGAGSVVAATDSLTITDSVFENNRANTASTATNNPGGAIQFIGGALSIDRAVFRSNSSGSSSGGAVYYQAAQGGAQTLSISNSTFQGNTASGTSGATGGGAVAIAGSAATAPMSIADSVFSANSTTGGSSHAAGVWLDGGSLGITGSTFTGNTASAGSPSAIDVTAGALTARYNRITGNTTPAARLVSGSADMTRTWWGCGGTPGAAGCDTVSGGVAVQPQLTLAGSAVPAQVALPGSPTSTVSVRLQDSSGTAVPGGSLAAFRDLSVAWTATGGTVSPTSASLASGSGATTFTASTVGPATVTAALDQARVATPVTVAAPPAITSASTVPGALGVASSFTVTTTGYPVPTLAASGSLPAGVTFTDNGNGTATIAGTPTGQARDYPITVTAANGVGSPATQALTYAMTAAPAFTSANSATFTTGVAGSFTVTTSGRPTPTISRTGALPNGLTFTDNGDGTATIAGTPANGTGGQGGLVFTAANGQGSATQSFTLTVQQPPAFTSGWVGTARIGTPFSFPITTSGYPAAAIALTGTLPSGLVFTDNGSGVATISGTPTGSGGVSTVTLTATGAGSPATGTLTLNVHQAPAVTLNPAAQAVTDGSTASFTATASGFPAPTVQWQRSTDGGANYANLAGATSTTYSFTAGAQNDGALYRAVFSNVAGSAVTTAATLSVGTAPGFTSAAAATVAEGAALSFAVTTSGYPAATLSRSGSGFPAWLTLTDNGDGTGLLSGTAPQGSGGVYPFVLSAANGFQPTAQQSFALTVTQAPAFLSAPAATFTASEADGFFVSTRAGWPATTAVSLAGGSLPNGVTLVDRGDGTAVLGGTPAAGAGGVYPITLAASNGVGPATTQAFTLTVREAPALAVASSATATVGTSFALAATALRGYPAPALTASGLPAGITFTDNGDGSGSFGGTPTGPGGVATVTIVATNGVGAPASKTVALTVREAPQITTPAADRSVKAGETVTFTAAASGFPAPSVQWSVSTDGTTFRPLDGETGTSLSFPAALADAGKVYRATFTNAVGSASTDARLAVGTSPAFTSADTATMAAGGGVQTFTVTTSGTPAAAITGAGLPVWATLTDQGDGTAVLAAAPPAGSAGRYTLTLAAENGYDPRATQVLTLDASEAPVITSADAASFSVGAAGTFTVTTTSGWPVATTIAVAGPLPDGVSFTDNGDGTATIAGTPPTGAGGTYAVTVSATNGASAPATQAVLLTVNEATSFTGSGALAVTRGVEVRAAITTAHAFPAVSGITAAGLPSGLTLTQGPDGTATITGITTEPAGTYTATLTATAPGMPDVTRDIAITVTDAAVLPLPPFAPAADGPLGGVPGNPAPGQSVTLVATGFAAFSPVTFGIYSAPVVLAVVDADAQGTATATVVLPAGYTGSHTLLAVGTAPDGSVRELRSGIVLPAAQGPSTPGPSTPGPSTPGQGAGGPAAAGQPSTGDLASTGLDVSALALLAGALLLGGLALAARRRTRRA
ncbi:putative Ig domain-containing protein [Leifsonia sp. F6_8S_P_1B]|uniref:Ig domain-containing protein n=1 Tax=Leifsonia williamsii TaxID=3035919 RepID=A0ABT8K6S2_9MICO|nr:putative Ig domain-containing protein [Leifsonia williamsii]MDN4613099.1 putative Ig domain-containing protein [Leifsonia williamsii]